MQHLFDKLVSSPWQSDSSQMADLAVLRKQYPFCATIHTLEAIHALKADKGLHQEMVRKAAVYSFSRAQLRLLIRQTRFPVLNNPIETLSLSSAFTPENVVSQIEPIKEAEKDYEENSAKFTAVPLPNNQATSLLQNEISTDKESFVEKQEDLSGSYVPDFPLEFETKAAMLLDDIPVKIEENVVEQTKPDAKKPPPQYIQLDLINQFIEKEPRIKPGKSQSDSDTQKDLSAGIGEWDKEIVSETLAIVLLKQKKFEKAIDMYEKLKLKFPEKTTYFAALIENIRKLIDSKTDNS